MWSTFEAIAARNMGAVLGSGVVLGFNPILEMWSCHGLVHTVGADPPDATACYNSISVIWIATASQKNRLPPVQSFPAQHLANFKSTRGQRLDFGKKQAGGWGWGWICYVAIMVNGNSTHETYIIVQKSMLCFNTVCFMSGDWILAWVFIYARCLSLSLSVLLWVSSISTIDQSSSLLSQTSCQCREWELCTELTSLRKTGLSKPSGCHASTTSPLSEREAERRAGGRQRNPLSI